MSPPAVVYIRADNGMDPVRQRVACVEACLRERVEIRYWAQGGPGALADALRIIDAGKAEVLVVAHPEALGDVLAQEAIRAQLSYIGARLLTAARGYRPRMSLPPGAELAARMRRQGMSEEQIGHVLQVDRASVRALLRDARKHGLLGVSGLVGAWLAERPAQAAAAAAIAGGLMLSPWGDVPQPAPERAPHAEPAQPTPSTPSPPPSRGTPPAQRDHERPGLQTHPPAQSPRPGLPTPSLEPSLPPSLPSPRSSHDRCLRLLPPGADLNRCTERSAQLSERVT